MYLMQEKAGEQGAAYIPMPKGRGFTPHFDNIFIANFALTFLGGRFFCFRCFYQNINHLIAWELILFLLYKFFYWYTKIIGDFLRCCIIRLCPFAPSCNSRFLKSDFHCNSRWGLVNRVAQANILVVKHQKHPSQFVHSNEVA